MTKIGTSKYIGEIVTHKSSVVEVVSIETTKSGVLNYRVIVLDHMNNYANKGQEYLISKNTLYRLFKEKKCKEEN